MPNQDIKTKTKQNKTKPKKPPISVVDKFFRKPWEFCWPIPLTGFLSLCSQPTALLPSLGQFRFIYLRIFHRSSEHNAKGRSQKAENAKSFLSDEPWALANNQIKLVLFLCFSQDGDDFMILKLWMRFFNYVSLETIDLSIFQTVFYMRNIIQEHVFYYWSAHQAISY